MIPVDPKDIPRVEEIPGLVVVGHAMRGTVDAIAASYLARGMEVPLQKGRGAQSMYFPIANLRDYQKDGVLWLRDKVMTHSAAILADEMGLGKTVQSIATALSLKADRVIVVCPASAIETWRQEWAKWCPKAQVWAEGEHKPNVIDLAYPQVVLCSYDHRVVERALDEFDVMPDLMILDELHRLRGRKSKRTEALAGARALCSFAIGLTATPQYDRPRDLYAPLRILFGHTFGTPFQFDMRYCAGRKNTAHGGVDNRGVSHEEELKLRLSFYMLRREKKDVAKELPPMTINTRWVEATPEAIRSLNSFQMGMSRMGLQNAIESTLKGKTEEALDLAADAKRFVLATWRRQDARAMARILATEYSCPNVCITGDLDRKERAKLIALAEARGWGLVATTDSIAENLNLQGVASVGILHALPWEPNKAVQLFSRLHRLGQTQPVEWYVLMMKGSVDTIIGKVILEKMDQWRKVIGGKLTKGFSGALEKTLHGKDVETAEKEALKQIYAMMK